MEERKNGRTEERKKGRKEERKEECGDGGSDDGGDGGGSDGGCSFCSFHSLLFFLSLRFFHSILFYSSFSILSVLSVLSILLCSFLPFLLFFLFCSTLFGSFCSFLSSEPEALVLSVEEEVPKVTPTDLGVEGQEQEGTRKEEIRYSSRATMSAMLRGWSRIYGLLVNQSHVGRGRYSIVAQQHRGE